MQYIYYVSSLVSINLKEFPSLFFFVFYDINIFDVSRKVVQIISLSLNLAVSFWLHSD